jgi:2-dehydro-3-deoxyphosphogluconate aldolase / (4S)-4-hydroxy-2-oxoglutarate aldolase
MEKKKTFQRIKDLGLLAVIRGPSKDETIKAVNALIKGGVKGIEITYSTPEASEVVKALLKEHKDEILLGMGTITHMDQVKMAIDSGAEFIVSPIFDRQLTQAFIDSKALSIIGCFSPSEMFQAYEMGADMLKVFPGQLAGPSYIRDIRGPFPDYPFVISGGVDIHNIADWFNEGIIAVAVGTCLCPKQLVQDGEFEKISQIAAGFINKVNKAKQGIERKKR